MGGNSQRTTGSSQSHTAPWSVQAPYLSGLYGHAQNFFNQGAPNFFPGQTYAPMSQYTQQGIQGLANMPNVRQDPLYGQMTQGLQGLFGHMGQANINPVQNFLGGMMQGARNVPMPGSYQQYGYGDHARYADAAQNPGNYYGGGKFANAQKPAYAGGPMINEMQRMGGIGAGPKVPSAGGMVQAADMVHGPGGFYGSRHQYNNQFGGGGGMGGLTGGQPTTTFGLGWNQGIQNQPKQNAYARAGINPTIGHPMTGGTQQFLGPGQSAYHWVRRR